MSGFWICIYGGWDEPKLDKNGLELQWTHLLESIVMIGQASWSADFAGT